MKKFVCPRCGGLIRQWIEYTRTDHKNINPQTGELSNKTKRGPVLKTDHMEGIECCNPKCSWFINYILESGTSLTEEENRLIEALFEKGQL